MRSARRAGRAAHSARRSLPVRQSLPVGRVVGLAVVLASFTGAGSAFGDDGTSDQEDDVRLQAGAAAGSFRSPRRGDGAYGRLDGQVSVVGGLGAAAASGGVRYAAHGRVRFVEVAGLFGTYEDSFSSGVDPERVVTAGFELRPLFLGRFLLDYQFGNPYLDLALDSLGFEMGLYWPEPVGASMANRAGVVLGGALEVPILPHASGPWIGVRGGMRFDADAASAGATALPWQRTPYGLFTLSWHQVLPWGGSR